MLPVLALLIAAAPAQKITIDVMDADIVNVLRLFADVSGKNFVIDDDVKGKVTLKLKNVPWDQALHVVLQTKDLGMSTSGSIVRVAPQAQLDAEEQARLDRYAARSDKGPLVTRIIVVNNARAEELLPHVQLLLTKRGTATADPRTNTIIVHDVASSPAF
jgi:type IV pilus assembly protein PilQ